MRHILQNSKGYAESLEFPEQRGYLFSRRSLSLQVEVNKIPSSLDNFMYTHMYIYIYITEKNLLVNE